MTLNEINTLLIGSAFSGASAFESSRTPGNSETIHCANRSQFQLETSVKCFNTDISQLQTPFRIFML